MKQHGLAGSRDPFWNHVSPSPGGKTSRLDPLKNYTVVVKLCKFPCKVQGTHFGTTFPPARGQNVTSGSTKKLYGCGQALKVSLEFPTRRTRDQGFAATGKQQGLAGSRSLFSVQNAPLKTGKQHGLAGSRDPFWNHVSPSPGGKTLHLNPPKNYTVLVRL